MDIELLSLAKKCLGIIEESQIKDDEINMLIEAAKIDMKRQGIETKSMNDLVKGTIVMYVKANFGMTDINEKKNAAETYKNNCNNMSLSSDYKVVE